jgi:cullin 3
MINKLTTECGHQFTARMEGMFKDMDLSKDMMKGYLSYSKKEGPELSVTVLTNVFWPLQQVPECALPPEATSLCDSYTLYYTNKHSGRRLTWQTSLGSAELRCQFKKTKKELVVHTYQMAILMLYNKKDKYSYAELMKITGIPDDELQRHLLSLAHPKVKVLLKNPNVKAVTNKDEFIYNHEFTHQMYKVKIPLMAAEKKEVKQVEIPPGVLEARKSRVEAAIVRIMKSRKTLEHNNLIAEVVKQLSSRFAAEPTFIRKRIESLIEREYLERDKNDRRIYHYLA